LWGWWVGVSSHVMMGGVLMALKDSGCRWPECDEIQYE
jgi:hypothetical protein